MTGGPFDDLPVIGTLAPAEAAAKLREVGEDAAAAAVDRAATVKGPPTRFGVSDW
jgi:hypothetical protein